MSPKVDGNPATSGSVNAREIASDTNGNIIFISGCSIRKVDVASGNLTTLAGNENDCDTSEDGIAATLSKLRYPRRVAVDSFNYIYVIDDLRILKFLEGGNISAVASSVLANNNIFSGVLSLNPTYPDPNYGLSHKLVGRGT